MFVETSLITGALNRMQSLPLQDLLNNVASPKPKIAAMISFPEGDLYRFLKFLNIL